MNAHDLVEGLLTVTVEAFDQHGAYIVVEGEIDACSTGALRVAIAQAIAARHKHLLIDLTDTTFLDGGTYRALCESLNPLRADEDSVVMVVGASGIVERVLDFVGAGRAFSLYPDRQAARRALRVRSFPGDHPGMAA